jgi:hypothetical protein
MSKYDSKDLWKTNDYKSLGIIAEPYFDTDFNKVFYLTDTGRTWNSEKFSVRDKVSTNFTQKFTETDQIITAFKSKQLPNQIMFTFHPQRWNDNLMNWLIELNSQNAKNLVKRLLIKVRK